MCSPMGLRPGKCRCAKVSLITVAGIISKGLTTCRPWRASVSVKSRPATIGTPRVAKSPGAARWRADTRECEDPGQGRGSGPNLAHRSHRDRSTTRGAAHWTFPMVGCHRRAVMRRVEVGRVLAGTYRIVRAVASGGMSAIYEATHSRLPGRYAIKVLSSELPEESSGRARFEREARVTALLRHPNIVEVIDFGTTEDGLPYLVMEYIDGPDLGDLLNAGGPLSPARTALLVHQIASALSAAHERGVVHRDLKPSNVMVCRLPHNTELVKVVDFGISKVRGATVELTARDVVLGTPRYMAPEQLLGRVGAINPATDQFALAAMSYELLTGTPAFPGDDLAAVGYQILHRDPVGLEQPTGWARQCGAVLAKGLAKRASDRYEDVLAFARAFELAAVGIDSVSAAEWTLPATGSTPPVRTTPEPTLSILASEPLLPTRTVARPTRRWPAAVLGAMVVAGTAAAALAVQRLREEGPSPTKAMTTSTPPAWQTYWSTQLRSADRPPKAAGATALVSPNSGQSGSHLTSSASSPPGETIPSRPISPRTRNTAASVWSSLRRRRSPAELMAQPSANGLVRGEPVTFSTLMVMNGALANSFSNYAHRPGRGDSTALVKTCAFGLAKRKPAENQGNKVEGTLAITLQVKGGRGHVAGIRALYGGDAEFVRCFAQHDTSLQGEFEVPGSPDTTVQVEWDYRLGWF